jgi:hypothetical protein
MTYAGSSDLYANIPIPVPSKPLIFYKTDTLEGASKKIDSYFEDLVRAYSRSTRALLRNMYYGGEDNRNDTDSYVAAQERLLREYKSAAETTPVNNENGHVEYETLIDSHLMDCDIIARMLKIHEIAGHIGQMNTRVEQVGAEVFGNEWEGRAFQVFIEQSATLAEKMLIDALPARLLIEDAQLSGGGRRGTLKALTRQGKLTDLLAEKDMPIEDYIRLAHYAGMDLTEEEHKRFQQLKTVQDFLAGFYPDGTYIHNSPRESLIGNSPCPAQQEVILPRRNPAQQAYLGTTPLVSEVVTADFNVSPGPTPSPGRNRPRGR